jgi:TonB family protein
MPLLPFVLLSIALLPTQTPAEPPALNCMAPTEEAVVSICGGDDLMRSARQPGGPADAMRRAADSFRRAATIARDASLKKLALTRLEAVYGAQHLNQPYEVEPILRELIALSPGDYAPIFRLARFQEDQKLFDAAESTLLAAHQQRMDDVEPIRELSEFFARRAAALGNDPSSSHAKAAMSGGGADENGVYTVGGGVPAPERTSGGTLDLPADAKAAGVTGPVMCEIVVDETGAVTEVKVVRSVPMLDAAAAAAVRTWRFNPAVVDGRAVPVRMAVSVDFQ